MKNLLLGISVVLLTACTSTPEIVAEYEKVQVVPIHKVTPSIGGNYVGEMGDALLTFEAGSYVAESTQNVTILAGLEYNSYKHPGLKSGSTVRVSKSTTGNVAGCFDEARYRGQLIKLCLYDLNNDGYFNYGRFDGRDIENIYLKYKLTTLDKLEGSNEYIKKQLVYRGFSSGKMLFSYLEYEGRMDKATHEEEFKVDYVKDNHVLVGYKGARLRVKKADSVSITYQLGSNFN